MTRMFIVWSIVGCLFICVGIYSFFAKKAIGFWANAEMFKVTDIKKYNGKTLLLAHIISLDFLWNEVRVKGGAYGTGIKSGVNGSVLAYSYRDPNARNSVEVFSKCGEYIRHLVDSEKSLLGFIIGAFSGISPLLTPSLVGFSADVNYIRGFSEDDRRELRKELVSTTLEDLNELSYILDNALSESSYCIVGPKNQVEAAGLDKIYSL